MKDKDLALQREIYILLQRRVLHLKLVNTLLLCVCSRKYNWSL